VTGAPDGGGTRIAAPWLDDPPSAAVTGMLAEAGHRAYFVGGCVRNGLIGAPVVDLDIATDARPERVVVLAGAAGLKAVPTGIEHGTVTLVSGGRPFEVTTFRRDVETDGRRAVVAYAGDLAEDAARRDFTMNALYAGPDGTVLDPVGSGLADLAARRVRFVGDPASRIAEDYLRVLRFFRFHAWYGRGDPDPAGLAACAAAQAGLARLSRERIGAEMRRLLAAVDPGPALAAMAAPGILDRVLPGARPALVPALVAAEAAAGAAPHWPRRLAALGPTAGWIEPLRLSRADARALAAIDAARTADGSPAALAYRFGAEAARDAALLAAAAAAATPPPDLEAALARGAAARFPLRAADLPGLSGPALGAALKRLEADWIATDFALDRAALIARV
jgi:poly(A) polymerase